MIDSRKQSEDIQLNTTDTIVIPLPIPTETKKNKTFKSLRSLPINYQSTHKQLCKMDIIKETDQVIDENPEIEQYKPRKSLKPENVNTLKTNYDKSIVPLPLQRFPTTAIINNASQSLSISSRLNCTNEITAKERRMIRQTTTKTNQEFDYQDNGNQTTQFKSFEGYMMTETNDGYQSTIPPLQVNYDILSNSITETDQSYSVTELESRRQQKRRELIRLMNTNPYQSLKHNVYFTHRKNQLAYDKFASNKPQTSNLVKSNKTGALYKANQTTTIYFPKIEKKAHLILRLLARRNEMSSEFKHVIFWKGIQWLWEMYFVQIEKLLITVKSHKWFLDKDKFTNQKASAEFFSLIHLRKASDFARHMFIVFDEYNKKAINLKFVLTVLIITNQISYKEQMKESVEVWEIARTGKVKIGDVSEIIKSLFSSKKDIKKLFDIIKQKFGIVEDFDLAIVDKKELLDLLIQDNKIAFLIRRNKVDREKIEQMYKDEISNLFNANIRNSKTLLDAHDAEKMCPNDIYKFEQVLIACANKDHAQLKIKKAMAENGEESVSDE